MIMGHYSENGFTIFLALDRVLLRQMYSIIISTTDADVPEKVLQNIAKPDQLILEIQTRYKHQKTPLHVIQIDRMIFNFSRFSNIPATILFRQIFC